VRRWTIRSIRNVGVGIVGWDFLGRVVQLNEPDPDGSGGPLLAPVTYLNYDNRGNLVRETDPLGRVTRHGYDAMSREVFSMDPAGSVSGATYDLAGQVTRTTDPSGRSTAYVMDAMGRTIQATLADPDAGGSAASPVLQWTFDAADNLLSETDARGNTIQVDPGRQGHASWLVVQPLRDARCRNAGYRLAKGDRTCVDAFAVGRILPGTILGGHLPRPGATHV